jgi:hypothetical protein
VSWLLLSLVIMSELFDIHILFNVYQMVRVISLAAAAILTIGVATGRAYNVIFLPEGLSAPWARHPALIRFVAKDYVVIAKHMVLEAAPIYFSTAMFWFICLITFRRFLLPIMG